MIFRNDFRLRPKNKADLSLALRMYGENEPPEMQIENMWEVYSPSTGMVLADSCPDFSEFSRGERMYPDMMEPEVKARWDEKNKELELGQERYAWRKRLAHVRFMRENPELSLAQELARTDYGKALLEEFAPKQPRQPQTGTGEDLHDEFERDGVEFNSEEPVCVTPFAVPGAEEPFSVLATARDEDGRIVEKLYSLEPKDHHVHYEYDAGGRLCAVWKDERLIEEYKYGKQGERYFGSTPQTGQQRFTYGPGLRLVRSGEVKYSYDDQGRLVMRQDGLDVTTYEYHYSGQLEQVNLPDGKRISYVIDPQGRRIAKSVNGKVAETYGWHDFTTLAVVAFEDGGNMEFVYDAEGDPVAMRSNGEVYYLASDQVGTIYMVANEAGDEVKRIIRDSFGNMIVDTNERMNIPLGFASGLYDRDTGLVHFGHREYDPAAGRFIQPDPIGLEGGDVDVYGYCHDDPVNFVDRMGLMAHSGMHGAFGSQKTGTRAKSTLGKNRDKNKNNGEKSKDANSSKSIGHGGIHGAFGTGNIKGRAHSTLGFNGKSSFKNKGDKSSDAGKTTAHGRSGLTELGYDRYNVYTGPSFSDYLGNDFAQRTASLMDTSDLWGGGINNKNTNKKAGNDSPLKSTAQRSQQTGKKADQKEEDKQQDRTDLLADKKEAKEKEDRKARKKAEEVMKQAGKAAAKASQRKSPLTETVKNDQLIGIGRLGVRRSQLQAEKKNDAFFSEKIDAALDFSHKAYSPLTHHETQKQASDFVKDKINGGQPAHEPVTNAVMQGWNNMIEKEKLKQQNRNKAARNLKPSKVTDIFSNNPEVRKNRIDTIKAGVEGGLKNYVDVQLSTPDTVIAPAQLFLKEIDKVLKNSIKQ